MRISYGPKADALYIKLTENRIDEGDEVAPAMIIMTRASRWDLPAAGRIEILDASKILGGRREMKVELALAEGR